MRFASLWLCLSFAAGLARAQPVELTHDKKAQCSHPQYSPDGKSIVFSSNRLHANQLWVMAADGSRLRQLTKMKWDMEPAWSPDGKRVAFASYGKEGDQFQVWVVGADGKDPYPASHGKGAAQYPCWSPDGSQLVWSTRDGLRLAHADGSAERQLTSAGGSAYQVCVGWSDAKTVVYSSSNTTNPAEGLRIWSTQADGSEAKLVVTHSAIQGVAGLTGDRSALVFGVHHEFYRIGLDPKSQPLHCGTLEGRGFEYGYGLSASPDGKSLVYCDEGDNDGDEPRNVTRISLEATK